MTKQNDSIKVKCEKCGKEYQLEEGANPSDFQCECGGELNYKKSLETIEEKVEDTTKNKESKANFWNKLSSKNKIIILGVIILIIALIVIAAAGYLTPSSQKYDKDGISFNYPSGWKLNGNGTNDNITVAYSTLKTGKNVTVGNAKYENVTTGDYSSFNVLRTEKTGTLDVNYDKYLNAIKGSSSLTNITTNNITVNGENAKTISYFRSSSNKTFKGTIVLFENENKLFILSYFTTSDSDKTFEEIISSFKIQ